MDRADAPAAEVPLRASMDARFSSRETLRILEGFGLTGHWAWDFAENTHVWSSGLYAILGLP
jgi:hypothetical protein